MVESLNVIALISGGKDSFYSILHCIQNGHKVVALGNLYPPPQKPHAKLSTDNEEETAEEEDLNSFMYQTVGHTIIPLYEAALGIPLYRQQITGSAIQTGTSYSHATIENPTSSQHEDEDETESLIPLLRKVMTAHPEANALSTGAILSTYQRTRIESVAVRLGLTPLSYLWQYPHLPPGTQSSLLNDMRAVDLDARIVKVASGGLDESFLWVNVAGEEGIGRVERGMRRFGSGGGGAVLGEGGEFETIVVDGPAALFKGRIEVLEGEGRVVREGGGSAWLRIEDAKVVMKDNKIGEEVCRVPDMLDQSFEDVLDCLKEDGEATGTADSTNQSSLSLSLADLDLADTKSSDLSRLTSPNNTLYWTVSGSRRDSSNTVADEANEVILKIRDLLRHASLESSCIVSTTIILRSMEDFATVNSIYGPLFTAPNPPSRVTISCGPLLPKGINIIVHLKVSTSTQRKGLHVQSRSYWAPANIGPYSQAISISTPSSSETESNISVISTAGQIPLVPSTMTLPALSPNSTPLDNFKFQTILSLQHLFRIATAMSVSWLTGTVAYLPIHKSTTLSTAQKARIAGQAWKVIHTHLDLSDDNSDDGPRDLWEEKHHAGLQTMDRGIEMKSLPDWDLVSFEDVKGQHIPSFWAAEVEELPRAAGIEWAALEGIAGSVKLSWKAKEDDWRVDQCWFGDVVQSVVQVVSSDDNAEIGRKVEEALESVDIGADVGAVSSWIDVSTECIRRALRGKRHAGVVPCRSLWDGDGRRLAAVLVFESIGYKG